MKKLFIACLFLFLFRLALFALDTPGLSVDTYTLVEGHARAIVSCLQAGQFSGCQGGGNFPLIQHLVAVPMVALGAETITVHRTLTAVSFFAFLALLVVTWRFFQRRGRTDAAWFSAFVFLTGLLIPYSRESFGESLAAFLTAAFTLSALSGARPLMQMVLLVLAGITKDTASVFLLGIGMMPLLFSVEPAMKAQRKLRFLAIFTGFVIAVVLGAAFNFFKFGVPYHAMNFSPVAIVPTFALRANFFAAIWFSPGGGLVFFWPAFVCLFIAVAVVRLRGALKAAMPIWAIVLMLALLTYGFASWYAPFGWLCWGPRLIIPWIPASTILLLHYDEGATAQVLRRLSSRAWLYWLFGVLLFIAVFPEFAVLFGGGAVSEFFTPTAQCPPDTSPLKDSARYYSCLNYYTWHKMVSLRALFLPALKFPGTLFALAFAGMFAGFWMRFKRQ